MRTLGLLGMALLFASTPLRAGTLGDPAPLYPGWVADHIARQYALGVYERAAAVGQAFDLVRDYLVCTGLVDGVRQYGTVTRTNQLLAGAWENEFTGGTNYPGVTAAELAELDAELRGLLGEYADTNYLPAAGADWEGWEDGSTTNWNFPRWSWESVYAEAGGDGLLTNAPALFAWDWDSYLMSTNHWRERFLVLDLLQVAVAGDPRMLAVERSWHGQDGDLVLLTDSTGLVQSVTFSRQQDQYGAFRDETASGHYYNIVEGEEDPVLVTFDEQRTFFNGAEQDYQARPAVTGSASLPEILAGVWERATGYEPAFAPGLVAAELEVAVYQYYAGDGELASNVFAFSEVTGVWAQAHSGAIDSSVNWGRNTAAGSTNVVSDYSAWQESTVRLYAGALAVDFDQVTTATGELDYGAPPLLSVPETLGWEDLPLAWAFSDSVSDHDDEYEYDAQVTFGVQAEGRAAFREFQTELKLHNEGLIDFSGGFRIWGTNQVTR